MLAVSLYRLRDLWSPMNNIPYVIPLLVGVAEILGVPMDLPRETLHVMERREKTNEVRTRIATETPRKLF